MIKKLLIICSFVVLLSTAVMAEESYPLRKTFPDCKPISTAELIKAYDDALIIDARFESEYDVVRIKNAVFYPAEKITKSGLDKIVKASNKKIIVFYCNGITCPKSYEADKKALSFGYTNSYVYDDGIFDWIKSNSDEALFWGKPFTAASLKNFNQIQSASKSVYLGTEAFLKKYKDEGYELIDLREPFSQADFGKITMPKVKVITFDKIVDLMNKGNAKAIPDSKFLVVDNVGKQVGWLYYYLKKHDKTDFYFLKGGVKKWQEDGFDLSGEKK